MPKWKSSIALFCTSILDFSMEGDAVVFSEMNFEWTPKVINQLPIQQISDSPQSSLTSRSGVPGKLVGNCPLESLTTFCLSLFFFPNGRFLTNRLQRAVKCQIQSYGWCSCLWDHTLHLFIIESSDAQSCGAILCTCQFSSFNEHWSCSFRQISPCCRQVSHF